MKQFLLIICAALLAAANLQAGGPVFGGGATVDTNALASGILTTAAANVAAGTNAQASGIITTAKAYTDAATNGVASGTWRVAIPRTVVLTNAASLNFPLSPTNAVSWRITLTRLHSTGAYATGIDYLRGQLNGNTNAQYEYSFWESSSGSITAGVKTNSTAMYLAAMNTDAVPNSANHSGLAFITIVNPLEAAWKTVVLSELGCDNFAGSGNWIEKGSVWNQAPPANGGLTNVFLFPSQPGQVLLSNFTYKVEYQLP